MPAATDRAVTRVSAAASGEADPDESLAARAARRRTGDRLAAAEEEVRRLLAVGLELMRENPSSSPRIADIVRGAGVSNDAFYRAFKSKDDLMAAIVDDGARRLVEYVRHQRDKYSDPVDQIRAVVTAVMAQAGDRSVADTTRAVLRHASRGPRTGDSGILEVRDRIAELLLPPLEQLSGADSVRDARVSSGAIFASMEQFLWASKQPSRAEVEHLVGWVLAGVHRG